MPKRGSGTELLSAWIMEALRFGAMIKGLGYRWVGFVMQLEFAEALILLCLLYDDDTFVSDFYVALSHLPSCLDGCLSRVTSSIVVRLFSLIALVVLLLISLHTFLLTVP
jgi:hypothetical protein